MRRTLLVLALLLTAGHAAADDSDDDFAPPTRARRGATEGSPRSSVEGSAEAASGDPAGAVATAKGGEMIRLDQLRSQGVEFPMENEKKT